MDRRLKKRFDRYWAKAYGKFLKEIDHLDYSSWFDFWHTHPDWDSKGNRNAETRAMVGALTYRVLKEVQSRADAEGDRLQVWATICQDTGNNAVYIHSENPNAKNFPYDFENTEWGVQPIPEVVGLFEDGEFEIGESKIGDETIYLIRKRA